MVAKLSARWSECGILPGDTVLFHSSLKRTLQEQGATPLAILESLLDAVGPSGTMILPLFNFNFTKGEPFDIRSTPSQMGVLTETARTFPGAVRSGHPIYSFAAIGAQSRLFDVDNFSGYGENSPFAILRQIEGKIAVLDLDDLNSMTFYHHIEEMHEVPYRFHKEFEGEYTGWDGNTSLRTYSLFVRNLDQGVLTDVNPMGDLLWERGLYHGFRSFQGIGCRTIKATEMYAAVSNVIEEGRAKGLLFSIEGEE
jgi:aminoglycoside 3-N-acetyltransferase